MSARKALKMAEIKFTTQQARVAREAMVDRLVADKAVSSARLEAAMREVPRHAFTPGADLVSAYADDVVRYRTDAHGVCLSSVSAPWMQAAMIEAAEITDGMRVLEIGSGGYNAALLRRMVGAMGRVTSVDIDPDAISRATAGLKAAGIGGVELILADAEHGVAEFAPYDRIIVTVAAWDVPAAWTGQLTGGGRIVLPLVMRGQQRIIAFDRAGSDLVSRSVFYGGFVPMQGDGAHRAYTLGFEDATTLVFDEGESADSLELRTVLEGDPMLAESGVSVAGQEPYDSLQLYLAAVLACTATLVFASPGAGHDLPAPQAGFPASADGRGTIAYLSTRQHGQGERARYEFIACGLGPDATCAAGELRDLVSEWHATIRRDKLEPQVTIVPAARAEAGPRRYALRKTHSAIVLAYPDPAGGSGAHAEAAVTGRSA
jgi:protein-L-isoaspartate(D-aspartate) O-methyltransferase